MAKITKRWICPTCESEHFGAWKCECGVAPVHCFVFSETSSDCDVIGPVSDIKNIYDWEADGHEVVEDEGGTDECIG